MDVKVRIAGLKALGPKGFGVNVFGRASLVVEVNGDGAFGRRRVRRRRRVDAEGARGILS